MFLRNDSPPPLVTLSTAKGLKLFYHKDISLTLNMAFRLCRHSKLQPPEPSRKLKKSCITDKNHSPDYVLAAFFLSFWSQQKERNEQNSFLRKDISLTLNMTLRHSEAKPHPQGVLICTTYACICGKNLRQSRIMPPSA